MGQISSGTGLISGLNTTDIINQLMAIESKPVTLLQTQITNVSSQQTAFTALKTQLKLLGGTGTTLKDPTAFAAATTTSSDPTVLSATASNGAAIGSYQFQVARLVTTQQAISKGFTDSSSTPVGAGTITIDQGGGEVTSDNGLSDLNGGAGVSRGQFKITDRSGAVATIDTSNAITLGDVISKINTATNINVKASISGNHLVLTDQTGKTASDLIVQDVNNGGAAASLGIAGDSVTGEVTGTDINYLGSATNLTQINDGNGVQLGSGSADLSLDLGDGGSAVQVSLAGKTTLGAVVSAINAAGGSRVTASISGTSLKLINASGNAITATDLNGSKAAENLGLAGASTSGGVLTGSTLLAGLGSVLLSSLNGGQGLSLGAISIQSRADGSPTSVDLSAAKSFQDVIDTINNAGVGVTAAVNQAGDGLQITDDSGGTGNLLIAGASATALGIAGSFDTSTASVQGTNLHHQYISANSLLSNYNGGQGVSAGTFTITDSSGKAATVNVTSSASRLSDVISNINSRGIGVTASINQAGNGLLLTDTAGGSSKLAVASLTGSTATDLNIAGTAAGTTIDGSFEKSVAVTATDTLTTLQAKINNLGFGVSAQIINDGSASSPYRLSLTSTNSGRAGRVVIDGGTTGLGTQTLIQAQDAAVFVGGQSSAQPLLITSSKNTLSNVVNGVSITLNGVSSNPVTLSVTRDSSNVTKELGTFVTNFNTLIDGINTLTSYDTTTNTAGLLLGDSTIQQIQTDVYDAVETKVTGAGKYSSLADIGITIGDGAKLTFDQNKFAAAYAADPQSVENLFTQAKTGAAVVIESDVNKLVDPVSGILTEETTTLTNRTTQYQTRIDELNTLLSSKRSRLQTQFANLESVLAGLQSQQSALGSFTGTTTTSSGK